MRPILTDRVAWSVAVCLSVCHTSEPCKHGCTDRAVVWVEDLLLNANFNVYSIISDAETVENY